METRQVFNAEKPLDIIIDYHEDTKLQLGFPVQLLDRLPYSSVLPFLKSIHLHFRFYNYRPLEYFGLADYLDKLQSYIHELCEALAGALNLQELVISWADGLTMQYASHIVDLEPLEREEILSLTRGNMKTLLQPLDLFDRSCSYRKGLVDFTNQYSETPVCRYLGQALDALSMHLETEFAECLEEVMADRG
ncbi:hypothetical protein MMC12_006174 [Toensbergia leucococca]|nr:hypothetical protein [Toensbergia leucococca]